MPHAPLTASSLNDILANHRLYQCRHHTQSPRVSSLADKAAQVLGAQPEEVLAQTPLHLLPDHLREHVAHYTPRTALKRPIRELMQTDLPSWPQTLQQRHTAIYVAGLCGHTSEISPQRHPDARLAEGWQAYILQPLALGASPAASLAQLDVGRLLLATATREHALKDTVWRRVIRYANTRHGPLAPPSQPTRLEYEHRYRSHLVRSALIQLWGHLVDEYVQADRHYARKDLPPYTAALCKSAFLATHWDYDLLRLSVTESLDQTARRTPSRRLRTLRQALSDAATHPDTTQAARDEITRLNHYLGVFDVPSTARPTGQDSWHRAGLDHAFASLSDAVKQARRSLSSPQQTPAAASAPHGFADAYALIGLWTDSVYLRSPVTEHQHGATQTGLIAPIRKRFGRS